MSSEDYAGTREEYERVQLDIASGLFTCGPYPNRGEYTYCHTFVGVPSETQIRWAVRDNIASRGLTPGQRRQGIMEPLENQQKEQDQKFDDIFSEALGQLSRADAVVPMTMRRNHHERSGWKRGGDMPVERFDQSAPLPTRDGFFGTIQRQETIDKLTGESA